MRDLRDNVPCPDSPSRLFFPSRRLGSRTSHRVMARCCLSPPEQVRLNRHSCCRLSLDASLAHYEAANKLSSTRDRGMLSRLSGYILTRLLPSCHGVCLVSNVLHLLELAASHASVESRYATPRVCPAPVPDCDRDRDSSIFDSSLR